MEGTVDLSFLRGYPWWLHAAIVIGGGALGGLINAVLAGGPTYGIRLNIWTVSEGAGESVVHLGVWGSMIIGLGASALAWATSFHQTQPPAMIGGCLVAGLAGANYLTSQTRQAAMSSESRSKEQVIETLLDAVESNQATTSQTEPAS